MTMKFSHSGKNGDLLASLCFVKACLKKTGQSECSFHIQTNVKHMANVMERDPVMMSDASANFLKPLLKAQSFISEVTVGDAVPQDAFDLSNMRKTFHNFGSGDLRLWYYALCNDWLDEDLTKPILEAEPDYSLKDKIILCLSERYVPFEIDFSCLQKWSDRIVFVGTDFEMQRFCSKHFGLLRQPVKDALELARLMKGCKCVISNLNGNYMLAEQLKVRRICCWADLMKAELGPYRGRILPAPMNVIPSGGEFATCTKTARLQKLVEELLCQN